MELVVYHIYVSLTTVNSHETIPYLVPMPNEPWKHHKITVGMFALSKIISDVYLLPPKWNANPKGTILIRMPWLLRYSDRHNEF